MRKRERERVCVKVEKKKKKKLGIRVANQREIVKRKIDKTNR